MDRDIRRLAGFEAGTVTYSDIDEFENDDDYDVMKENMLLGKKYRADMDTEYRENFMIKVDHSASFGAESSVINEAKLIWDRQFAEDIAGI